MNFWRIGTKPWKDTLDVRYFFKISNSESHSMKTKDSQENASIRLWENLQKITMLWWCNNFTVFRIDMKDDLEENEGSVARVIGFEARDALRGQRSHMFHEHQLLLQAREKGKEVVKSQMQVEQSCNVSYRRTLRGPEVQQERLSQSFQSTGHTEARFRVQLHTEVMIATMMENFERNFRKRDAGLKKALSVFVLQHQ